MVKILMGNIGRAEKEVAEMSFEGWIVRLNSNMNKTSTLMPAGLFVLCCHLN
jgi:hypothetical protein